MSQGSCLGAARRKKCEFRTVFETQIAPMSEKFHVHFTPDYSTVSKGFRFKYYNKPFGMLHFMEHAMGYPSNTDHDDCVIILMDPDQILLRPITRDFRNSTILWKKTSDNQSPKLMVEHGSPFGQLYGFQAQWMTKVDAIHVANGATPVQNVSMSEARDYYSLGPPYIATGRDFYKIVSKWAEFVPRKTILCCDGKSNVLLLTVVAHSRLLFFRCPSLGVHEDYPHLLGE